MVAAYSLIDRDRFAKRPYQTQIDLLVSALESEAKLLIKANLSPSHPQIPTTLVEEISPFSRIAEDMADVIQAEQTNQTTLASADFQHHARLVEIAKDQRWSMIGRRKDVTVADLTARLWQVKSCLDLFGPNRGVAKKATHRPQTQFRFG